MKVQNRNRIRALTTAAVIAALYAVLTLALWEFSSLGIQCRLSEALCILPYFTPAAIPGLFIGCAIANLISGTWVDVVFGSLATLLAAICSYLVGKAARSAVTPRMSRFLTVLVPLPPVLVNAAVIPFVLYYGYGLTSMAGREGGALVLSLFSLSVGIGETIVCYGVGLPFLWLLRRLPMKQFL